MNNTNLNSDINLLKDTIKKYNKLLNLKKANSVRNELLFKMISVYVLLFVPYYVFSWVTKLPMIAFFGSLISLLSLIVMYSVIMNNHNKEVIIFINNNPDIDFDNITYNDVVLELSRLQTKLIALNSVMKIKEM